ncbi:hypothetical protein GGI21_000554 [Coemansia aciculifera]|nr:hypothetical protein GGI21_000554 [Coemansia aciculifera]
MDKDAKLHAEQESVDDAGHKGNRSPDTGLLERIALSATRLAGSALQGVPALDSDALAEAKLGRREGSTSTSLVCEAESSHATQVTNSRRQPELAKTDTGAASAFRQHLRTAAGSGKEQARDSKGKGKSGGIEYYDQDSHQVGLAQTMDGQDVAKFLSQTMPASMSTTGPIRTVFHEQQSLPLAEHQSQSQTRIVDPVAYLQGTGYAADMEHSDYRVAHRHGAQVTTDRQALAASPGGANRGWDEHGASVLEEWQLNEAWDRAWMNTAWGSAQRKAPAEPGAEPVLPSNKNLSYLLKPRI